MLKLKDLEYRIPDNSVKGALLLLKDMTYQMALVNYSGNLAGFVEKKNFPNGKMTFVEINNLELLEQEVHGFACPKIVLMEGHIIHFKDTNKEPEKVIEIKTGSKIEFPIITEKGEYNWDHISLIHI